MCGAQRYCSTVSEPVHFIEISCLSASHYWRFTPQERIPLRTLNRIFDVPHSRTGQCRRGRSLPLPGVYIRFCVSPYLRPLLSALSLWDAGFISGRSVREFWWTEWRSQELYALYCSPNIIWVIKSGMKWAVHVVHMWDRRDAYWVLMERPQRKRPLGKRRNKWESNIAMDLQDVEWRAIDWIDLAKDRKSWRALVNAGMNLLVSQNAGNFLTSLGTVSFSGRTVFLVVS